MLSAMRLLIPVLVVAAAASALAHAEARPGDAVRGYFQALDRQDFVKALALTVDAAQARTSHMVQALKSEAAAHHARVEVKVKHLDVRSPGSPEARGVPVSVAFHIDVVGHRWCFSKVARRLAGEARFFVDPEHPDRITAIEGRLE
jgi:hypothetical protein